jgi:uncharacterized membrane protein (UPF0127 family)
MRAQLVLLFLAVFLSEASGGARRLPVEKIVIDSTGGPRAFEVEIAADDASRANGLMHRTQLAPRTGMLFDFKSLVMVTFWMKDTPLPLDMLFVRADGTISTIAADAAPFSTAAIFSAEPVRAVIEINGGLAQTLGIDPGGKVHAAQFAHRHCAEALLNKCKE